MDGGAVGGAMERQGRHDGGMLRTTDLNCQRCSRRRKVTQWKSQRDGLSEVW
jgi:hypothetical protein